MSIVAEAEQIAMSLSERERARLASKLLRSLPSALEDDDSVTEALRRSNELKANPEIAISHEEFVQFFTDRRK